VASVGKSSVTSGYSSQRVMGRKTHQAPYPQDAAKMPTYRNPPAYQRSDYRKQNLYPEGQTYCNAYQRARNGVGMYSNFKNIDISQNEKPPDIDRFLMAPVARTQFHQKLRPKEQDQDYVGFIGNFGEKKDWKGKYNGYQY
jgi:hypothetical protein